MASGPQVSTSVTTVAVPMAWDVESLALCLRTLLSEDMYRLDPTVPRMPFREEDPRTSQHLEEIRGVGTPKKLREQHTAVEEYQQEFIAKWRSLDLDVLLVPVLGSVFYIGSSSLAQWVLVGLRLGVQDS
uniref:fatty-acid amide hydrolase 1 isoform X2 n=1 Tax=Macaca mulatta TaxID=9544 RepID=UPI0010A280AD|nr:fatty-acid amide hydrolase 1 isoform X2 [Macaca mulatta]